MTFQELENKICRVLRIDKTRKKFLIIYRYPQVVQPTFVKYEPVPLTDDEDMEIMFSTIGSHPCISGAELYIDIQTIEAPEPDCEQDDYEEAVRNIATTPNIADNEVENIGSVFTIDPLRTMDSTVSKSNIREASIYTAADDRVHVDNQLFSENDDESEHDLADEGDEAGTSHPVRSPEDTTVPNYSTFEAPSRTFTQIDWNAANMSMYSSMQEQHVIWQRNEELRKGLRFIDKAELQTAVKQYSVERHHEFKVIESNPNLWHVKCKSKDSGCQWMLRGIKRHNFFEISRYTGPHTCLSAMMSQDHSGLDSTLIANEIRDLVKEIPTIAIAGLGAVIKNKYNYTPSYRKLWDAKQKAIAMLFGDWDMSYQLLPKWLHAVQTFNPGTWVKFIGTPTGIPNCAQFDRVFWAFAPSIEGFKHCRPVISIDATFMYGKYKEKLLIATAIDGNNQIFPLAFGIVDEESADTWGWFLACIRNFVTTRQEICLISDRHAGILAAVQNEYLGWQPPHAYHVYCLRHVASNFNSRFRDPKLRDVVKRAGMQTQPRKFHKYMRNIEKFNPEAVQWLNEIPLAKWTRSHDDGRRYGMMTTNISECFNGVLKNARFLPITALVQLTFFRLVSYFEGRRVQAIEAMDRNERFTPFVTGHVISNQAKATSHTITRFDRATGLFQVQTARRGPNMNKGDNTQVFTIFMYH